ncbi:ImmA/IrrE family metallo-endopeptidase [Pleomorphochaeta sp. DL1XJH-081]|uniref:ImmA/IrrE family metallo-endopeptidase n=1 Tax=Pleomorphochaeta sp. DL1XJH-081 TaxID=3409690 RepID=UPI003BB65B85
MRLNPDYQQPIIEALIVLEDAGIDRFPVSLHAIQHQFRNLFQIRSYGSIMEQLGISREECFKYLGSEDGVVASVGGNGKYIIYYNEKMSKRRTRFTIAHEMGHIFLAHHDEYEKAILARGGIGKILYDRLENEASCFARNLLCPAYHVEKLLESHGFTKASRKKDGWVRTKWTQITENLEVIFHAEDLVESAFDVSSAAAEARMGFLYTDLKKCRDYSINCESTEHIKHAATWYCSHCGWERMPGASHCFECGRKHFSFKVNTFGISYRDLGVNTHTQFSPCPVCGNEIFSEDAGYCRICGTPLSNPCTHDPTHLNHPEAKHCYACGKPTAFKDSEYHIQIKQSLEKYAEGDFSMIYKSGIKYDRNTNRVKECPRCQNEEFSADATYCRICGLPLVNNCIPGQWEDDFGNRYPRDPHENLPDSRFCEQCGEPTVYFQNKLLKTYREILGLPEAEDDGDEFDPDIPF